MTTKPRFGTVTGMFARQRPPGAWADQYVTCPECNQWLLPSGVKNDRDEEVHPMCAPPAFTWTWTGRQVIDFLERYWAEKDAAAQNGDSRPQAAALTRKAAA